MKIVIILFNRLISKDDQKKKSVK